MMQLGDAGQLGMADLTGGTFSLSNIGAVSDSSLLLCSTLEDIVLLLHFVCSQLALYVGIHGHL